MDISSDNSSNKDSGVDKVVCISYQDHGLSFIYDTEDNKKSRHNGRLP